MPHTCCAVALTLTAAAAALSIGAWLGERDHVKHVRVTSAPTAPAVHAAGAHAVLSQARDVSAPAGSASALATTSNDARPRPPAQPAHARVRAVSSAPVRAADPHATGLTAPAREAAGSTAGASAKPRANRAPPAAPKVSGGPAANLTLAPPEPVLRIEFLLLTGLPSEALRARMIASVLRQRADAVRARAGCAPEARVSDLTAGGNATARAEALARWTARVLAAPPSELPHAVLTVKKTLSVPQLRALWSRCVLVVVDAVDNTDLVDGWMGGAHGYPVDQYAPRALLLVQTRRTASMLASPPPNTHFRPIWAARRERNGHADPVAVLPHSHTNVGKWQVRAPAESARRAVRVVGLLVGQALNAPPDAELRELAGACCARGAALRYVHELPNRRGTHRAHVLDFPCDGWHSRGAARVWLEKEPAARSPTKRAPGPSLADSDLFNFSAQRAFHDVAWVRDVDVGLLWPPSRAPKVLLHRPPTRLLWWWSHGVPALFFPYAAYVEAARDANYTLPWPPAAASATPQRAGGAAADAAEEPTRATGLDGRALPVVASARALGELLERLGRAPEARRALAARGLRAVRDYDPEATAARLVETVRDAVATAREDVRRSVGARPGGRKSSGYEHDRLYADACAARTRTGRGPHAAI